MGREALGEFEHQVLLTILRLDAKSYSVPIVLELEERTGKSVAPAAVHIALTRLEKKGLVSSRLVDPRADEGGRVRRYFELQPKGIERLKESRRTLASLWEGLDPVLDT
jgi:DNA-binding PadR family transcriptional regulator